MTKNSGWLKQLTTTKQSELVDLRLVSLYYISLNLKKIRVNLTGSAGVGLIYEITVPVLLSVATL